MPVGYHNDQLIVEGSSGFRFGLGWKNTWTP
jgi:hypothetical protein